MSARRILISWKSGCTSSLNHSAPAQLVATQRPPIGFVGTCILLFQTRHQQEASSKSANHCNCCCTTATWRSVSVLMVAEAKEYSSFFRGELVVAEVVFHDFLQIARQDFNALLGLDRLLYGLSAGDLSVDFSSASVSPSQGRLLHCARHAGNSPQNYYSASFDGARKLRIVQPYDFRNAAVDFRLWNGFTCGARGVAGYAPPCRSCPFGLSRKSISPRGVSPPVVCRLHSGEGFAATATECPRVGRRKMACARLGFFFTSSPVMRSAFSKRGAWL